MILYEEIDILMTCCDSRPNFFHQLTNEQLEETSEIPLILVIVIFD